MQKPPQGASAAPGRGRSASWHNQPTTTILQDGKHETANCEVFSRIPIDSHRFSRDSHKIVSCLLDYASELSAHDACAQRPPAGASARS